MSASTKSIVTTQSCSLLSTLLLIILVLIISPSPTFAQAQPIQDENLQTNIVSIIRLCSITVFALIFTVTALVQLISLIKQQGQHEHGTGALPQPAADLMSSSPNFVMQPLVPLASTLPINHDHPAIFLQQPAVNPLPPSHNVFVLQQAPLAPPHPLLGNVRFREQNPMDVEIDV